MSHKEILELLLLKDWTRADLAAELGFKSRNIIDRWFVGPIEQRRYPSSEHVKKMRAWLTEAREETRSQPA